MERSVVERIERSELIERPGLGGVERIERHELVERIKSGSMAQVAAQHRLTLLRGWLETLYLTNNGDVTPRAARDALFQDLEALDASYGYDILPAVRLQLEGGGNSLFLPEAKQLSYGRFTYEPELHTVTTPYPEHAEAYLTQLEGRMFHYLIANGGRLVPYTKILDAWSEFGQVVDREGDLKLMKTHISHIRDKIGDDGRTMIGGRMRFRHIRVLANAGYGFYDPEIPHDQFGPAI